MIARPPKRDSRFRIYASHRRAWTPRLWPLALGTVVTTVTIAELTNPNVWESIALGLVVGLGGSWLRWAIWRHRHPIISHAEFLDLRRRNAPWN